MDEPLRDDAAVRQDITTSGSGSSAAVGTGVQVNVVYQQPGSAPSEAVEPRQPSPVHNLPHRDRSFTGREDQLTLLRERLVSGGAAVVQAVHGMGGVGKTQLVLEYAHRHLAEYDVVWRVSAEQAGLIGEQFAALGVALGIVDAAADSTVVKSKVLEHLSGRGQWLLIFDNAVRREDVLPWLPRDVGHVLITSRSGNWHQVARAVELDVLAHDEAVRFLVEQHPGLDLGEAGLLAEALGDLPLALAQAVAYLAETGMSVVEYRQLLAEETQAVLALGQPINYPQSLAAAITLSVGALSEVDPAAVAILRLCALLAPEPIPVDLIVEVAQPVEAYPQALQAVREIIAKPLARQQVIGHLGAYGLARLGSGTVTVHRLTQAVVRSQLEASASAELGAHLQSALGAMNPGDPKDSARWPAWGRLLPHLLATEPAHTTDPVLRECARDAVVYLISRGDSGPARQLAENLHAGWKKLLGDDHQDTLRAATELVWALRDLGEIGRLRPLIDDTLTRQIDTLGQDHPDTLRSAADLAVVHNALGNHRRAEEIGRDVLERRRRLFGDDHPDTLMTAGNVASTVGDLGRFDEAFELERDVLERRRRVLGEDHPDTLMTAGNVASTIGELGRHREALELQRDLLERRRRVLGEDHPDTLTTAGSIASTTGELGRYEEALELGLDVLERRQRVLGEDHPDTLTAVSNVASMLVRLGRSEEALELHRDVLERRRRVLGENHPDRLVTAGNVAATVGDLGRHHEALELLNDVSERHRQVLGENHPDTLMTAGNVASTLGELGRHEEALALQRDVLERHRRVLGEDHPNTLVLVSNVATTLWRLERHEEALRLETDLWERRRRVLGPDHPDTLLSGLHLAITYYHLDQFYPARRLADQAWKGLRERLGSQHPHTQRAAEFRNTVAGAMGGRKRRRR